MCDTVSQTGYKKPLFLDAGLFNVSPAYELQQLNHDLNYRHEAGDLFILTFPRSGTTWTQQLVHAILHDGDSGGVVQAFYPLFVSTDDEADKKPFKSHIRPDLLLANMHPEAKYLIIARNPKDVVVSLFHDTKEMPEFGYKDGTLDDFFEVFMQGETEFGDHMHWLSAAVGLRHEPNVLLLTYESMKADFESTVLRVAKFLSTEKHDYLLRWQTDVEYKRRILTHCDIHHMRREINPRAREEAAQCASCPEQQVSGYEHVRKGQVNGWRQHLSDEQSQRLNRKFKSAVEKCPDLLNIWEDYSWL